MARRVHYTYPMKTIELVHSVSGQTMTVEVSKHSWAWRGDEDWWLGGEEAGKAYLSVLSKMGWLIVK